MKKGTLFSASFFALAASSANADVVTPKAVTATHSLAAYPIVHTINSHGLTDTDPDVLNWTHDPTPSNTNDKSWLGTRAGNEIVYELDGPNTITDLYFWSYWGGHNNIRSVTQFDISFSSNGVDYSTSSTIILGTPSSATEKFGLGTQAGVTHVKFSNIQNGGDNLAGIGEVRFEATFAPPVRSQLVVESDGADLIFTWDSQPGKVYDLLTSIDPENDGDPNTWSEVAGQQDIPVIPDTTTLTVTITRPADPTRLYVVREENAPPPPPAFFDDFETVPNPDWTTGTNGGDAGTTVWERGTPINVGPSSGYDGSTTCFGTNISADYTLNTDIWLRTPPIDLTGDGLTGATLSFWQHRDTDLDGEVDDDYGTIRVLDANSLAQLGGDIATDVEGFDFDGENNPIWVEFEATALPAEALGKEVVIEFRFKSDDLAAVFAGWYIDNVMVEVE